MFVYWRVATCEMMYVVGATATGSQVAVLGTYTVLLFYLYIVLVSSSNLCSSSCERCWSCMVTCKLLCVMYVAVVKCVGVGEV